MKYWPIIVFLLGGLASGWTGAVALHDHFRDDDALRDEVKQLRRDITRIDREEIYLHGKFSLPEVP